MKLNTVEADSLAVLLCPGLASRGKPTSATLVVVDVANKEYALVAVAESTSRL